MEDDDAVVGTAGAAYDEDEEDDDDDAVRATAGGVQDDDDDDEAEDANAGGKRAAAGGDDGEDDDDDDDDEDEDDDEEPMLKYQRLGNDTMEILEKDMASCMAVADKFLVRSVSPRLRVCCSRQSYSPSCSSRSRTGSRHALWLDPHPRPEREQDSRVHVAHRHRERAKHGRHGRLHCELLRRWCVGVLNTLRAAQG